MVTRETLAQHLTLVRFEVAVRTDEVDELRSNLRNHIWNGDVPLFTFGESITLHKVPEIDDDTKDNVGDFFFGESYTP